MSENISYHQLNDQELLNAFYQKQESQVLGILLERYTLLLLGVCMKYLKNEDLAKDSVQQIFLKIIQELPRYRVTYFKSWIYMIAKNFCLMYLRDNHKTIPTELKESHETTVQYENDLTYLTNKELLLDLIDKGLQTLNKEQKECVTLFYLEKKSYKEISDQTGYNLLQIKSHIQNGKRNIKIWVEKQKANNE